MKYDRVATIPIRHRLKDYLCTIAYSEYEGVFHFVSARFTDPRKTESPKNGFNLYLRILKEPSLRANLLEAFVPEEKDKIEELRDEAINERAKNYGFFGGFVALCVLGYALYWLTLALAHFVGYSTAEAITYLPAFFAFLVIFPVQQWVGRWYKRRYCSQRSHRLESFKDKKGIEVTWCKRCGIYLGGNNGVGRSTNGEP